MYKTKIKKIATLFMTVIMIASCFTCIASAASISMNNQSSDTGSFSVDIGSKFTIVGKSVMCWDDGLNATGMNITGWRKGTNTMESIVAVAAGSNYTGYIAISVVNYNTGADVVSSSRGVGTKISDSTSNTWYKELTKASYTAPVTSYATVEAVYGNTVYYGTPNVIGVSK